jgi:hypothetical protein
MPGKICSLFQKPLCALAVYLFPLSTLETTYSFTVPIVLLFQNVI